MLESMFGKTISWLEKSLNVRLVQHDLLASDIANSETPGFKEEHLNFRKTMASFTGEGGLTLVRTDPGDLPGEDAFGGGRLDLVSDPGPQGADGNSVNMDTEMVRLGENGLLYNATVQALAHKLDILKEAIEGAN